MYAVDDDSSYALAMREALSISTALMALTLTRTLLSDPRMPDDIEVPYLGDAIANFEGEKEWRMKAIAEYKEKVGETAERAQRRSLEGPQ